MRERERWRRKCTLGSNGADIRNIIIDRSIELIVFETVRVTFLNLAIKQYKFNLIIT